MVILFPNGQDREIIAIVAILEGPTGFQDNLKRFLHPLASYLKNLGLIKLSYLPNTCLKIQEVTFSRHFSNTHSWLITIGIKSAHSCIKQLPYITTTNKFKVSTGILTDVSINLKFNKNLIKGKLYIHGERFFILKARVNYLPTRPIHTKLI